MATDETLEQTIARLNREKDAIREEFTNRDMDDPKTPTAIRKRLGDLIPKALDRMEWLMHNAEKDATQLQVAKYVLDIGLGRGEKITDNGPSALEELIANLTPAESE